jgi:putative ABC transport system permease protein
LYWLRNFAFKIDVGPLLFVVPVLLLSGVIISAVGVQSVKAASRNPVDVIGNQ